MLKLLENIRKYSWYFIRKIFELEDDVIVWHSRFDGQPDLNNIEHDCMISVDCCYYLKYIANCNSIVGFRRSEMNTSLKLFVLL
jgi:hypothetical protein